MRRVACRRVVSCVVATMLLAFVSVAMLAQRPSRWRNVLREADEGFFKTAEASRVGDQLIDFQRVTGGWPKNVDMVTPLTEEARAKVLADKNRRDDSTTDNNATSLQMVFLARLYQATGEVRFRDAFRRGVEYLLSGQYANGGWPQFWPENRGYQVHITFNDNAMVNTMNLLKEVYEQHPPYQGDICGKALRKRASKAFDKGVECILRTQMVWKGELTVWCQQHDRKTFAPAPARAYELPSFCSQESAAILHLLMNLENPSKEVIRSVHAGMRWFDRYKLTGLRVVREHSGRETVDTRLEADPSAPPIWARFYDLERCEPYVCDRDGVPRRHLHEIGPERRNGYSWYSDRSAFLYEMYDAWADKYDPSGKVSISLSTPGANENGTIVMFRQSRPSESDYDAVVRPGESIQSAIDRAPSDGKKPFAILIKKGEYNEKVIIGKPNIVLVGEQRDSTRIVFAEVDKTIAQRERDGKKVGNGVIVIQEGADDCVISGLTVYNNYGTTVERTTTHQKSIYGRATRTIVLNCNVWADGNDALSLWAPGGDGMYYHADLDLRCPGVDFLCPRGWCYATRCRFYGDGRALIWHDGRGDKTKKLVITNSTFDSKSPAPLGRWHHDSQFILVKCHMSSNIKDANMAYAYADRVEDPCPWGVRTYYYGCTREGGHSGWLDDNLSGAEGSPEFHAVTAHWTFGERWDPESRIRELWRVLAY